MIVLTKGTASDVARLTLTEKLTITALSYRLVFTSRLTKEVVTISGLADTSAYPERYNKLTIDTETNFSALPEGFYDYEAYAVNGSTTELLEVGCMKLLPETAFAYTAHTPEVNTYKAYQG